MRRYYRLSAATVLFQAMLFAGCAMHLEVDHIRDNESLYSVSTQLDEVPFFPQREYQCGPAALAMMLNWSGVNVTPEQLVPLVFVPGRKGSFQVEMSAATRQFNRIPYQIEPSLYTLIEEIDSGSPVLVLQNLGLDWLPQWHYAVVKGVDVRQNTLQLHSGTNENYNMPLDTFERTWLRAKKWAMLSLTPGKLPRRADPLRYLAAVNAFSKMNSPMSVEKAYQAAVDRWPDHLTVRMALANFFFKQGDLKAAGKQFREAIKIDQHYAPAHNNLANVLLQERAFDAAVEHALKAVEIGGKYAAHYQETLHEIRSAMKKPENR